MVQLQWSAIPLALSSPSRAMWLPIPATTNRRNFSCTCVRRTRESVMVSQCANPDCRRELRYLRDGKIYIFAMSTGNGSKSLEHFWLCGECSKSMTLTCLKAVRSEDRASEASYKPPRFGSVALETVHRNDRNTKQRNP